MGIALGRSIHRGQNDGENRGIAPNTSSNILVLKQKEKKNQTGLCLRQRALACLPFPSPSPGSRDTGHCAASIRMHGTYFYSMAMFGQG